MKKSKKFLSVLCAVCMILAVSTSAFAANVQPRIEQDPFDHAKLSTTPYDFSTTDDYPFFRLWIRNYDSHSISGTISYANGTSKTFSVGAANTTTGYTDYSTPVTNPGAGDHSISLRADDGGTLNGELSLHIDATGHFRLDACGYSGGGENDTSLLGTARIEQDPFDHAKLTTTPYDFSTTDDYPYFRLWIRNTSNHAILGTITYGNDSTPKEFTVDPADPDKGYTDYSSGVLEPGAGEHTVTIRGEAGYTMSGALSLHIDSTGHFRAPGWMDVSDN